MGDHTEAIQVDYDPSVISYEDIMRVMWATHNPVGKSYSIQYRNAVWFANEEQKAAAASFASEAAEKHGKPVTTAIEPLGDFWLAEDYHQKYRLRNDFILMSEFQRMFRAEKELLNSTAAMRANAYASGYGSKQMIVDELDDFGFSSRGTEYLKKLSETAGDSPLAACGVSY